jgi:hypothetical protein
MLPRTVFLVVVVAAYLAVGPWALLAALLSLFVPKVRRAVRPRWRPTLVFLALVGAAAAAIAVLPDGRLPIPPGGGLLVTPAYVGGPYDPEPIELDVEQNPNLAANGFSSMHNDGWATDAYTVAGPLGDDPEVDTAWYGIKECATIAFDTKGRMIALCGNVKGPIMHVVDLESMDPTQTLELPGRTGTSGKRPWEDLCGGAYFYLDEQDVAYVGTTERSIAVVTTSDAYGDPELRLDRTLDLTGVIPEDDCVIALMPDWDGAGSWWVTRNGRVGHVTEDEAPTVLDLGEGISNSVSADDEGLFVVTDDAFFKIRLAATGEPEILWKTPYTNSGIDKSGQLSPGSGTTPTVLPSGLVAITDNAEPRMNVQFYEADTGELVCEAPVFEDGESSSDNSLVMVGEASVVVENNFGNDSPLSAALGRGFPGGFSRVDVVGEGEDRECRVAWTSDEIGPSTVPKVSLPNGLVYTYTVKPNRWGVTAWYVTAISAATGDTAFSVRTGTGTMFNNHGAPVTLAPDGSLYVPTLTGMVRVRDGD